jgi:hypothetical protein
VSVEDRTSILDSVKPTGALERLSARNARSTWWYLVFGAAILLALGAILFAIITNTTQGTSSISVPTVNR